MSEFKTKVGKPVLITNTHIEDNTAVFGLRTAIYRGIEGTSKHPYAFYNLNEDHTLAICRLSSIWLKHLSGVPNRPRCESLFLLSDVDKYVDMKFNQWMKAYSSKIKPITDEDSVVDGSCFIKVATDGLTYFNVYPYKVLEHSGKFKGGVYEGYKSYFYLDLKEDRDIYFFTTTDLNRMKEDIKELYRKLNKKYSAKVKSLEITTEGHMLVNDRRIV